MGLFLENCVATSQYVALIELTMDYGMTIAFAFSLTTVKKILISQIAKNQKNMCQHQHKCANLC